MKYKILIFDLDDTLIDNRESVRAAFKQMLSEADESFSEDAFNRWYELDRQFWVDWQDGAINIPDHLRHETGKKSDQFLDWVRSQRVLMYFDNSITSERAVELNNIYMHSLHDVVVPIDGARDTLEYLFDRNYEIIVATNGPQVATRQKLEKVGARRFITEVLSADLYGYMKPSIEFFEAIEGRYDDYRRGDYLIIGDSLKSDVGFGMNAGIDSCWLDATSSGIYDAYSPTYIISNLNELKEIL